MSLNEIKLSSIYFLFFSLFIGRPICEFSRFLKLPFSITLEWANLYAAIFLLSMACGDYSLDKYCWLDIPPALALGEYESIIDMFIDGYEVI